MFSLGTAKAIFSGLITVAQAIPALVTLYDYLYDLYTEKKLGDIQEDYDSIQDERKAIINSISRAVTNEERRALSITLSRLSKLSNSDS